MAGTDEPRIVVQTEVAGGEFQCRGFSGVPAAVRSRIAIVSSGSDKGREHVSNLAAELESVLLASSPEAKAVDIDCPEPPGSVDPAAHPDRRKVLVLVGSADAKFSDVAWYQKWQSDLNNACVMLVLPPGAYEDQFDATITNDEHLLRRINAAVWQKQAKEALPSILARAGITSSATRIFISYRRLETVPVALQLFDRFTHEGFDVFLDRFSIAPGYDFQRRLTQELEDKSMVVLLESKSLKDSKWTRHEVDFATKHRLGILALRMPDAEPYDHSLAREDLKDDDFSGKTKPVPDPARPGVTVNQWPELKKEALQRVTEAIRAAHARALFERRYRLRTDLVASLNAVPGVRAEYRDVGPLLVTAGKDEHVIWLTTWPPEVDDFRGVHGANLARVKPTEDSLGLIVGPKSAQEPDRMQRLEWLHAVTHCLSFDEGDLPGFAKRVKEKNWK